MTHTSSALTTLALATAALIGPIGNGVAHADSYAHTTVTYVSHRRVVVRHHHYRPRPLHWSLGMHVTGVTTTQKYGDEGVSLGGLGGHIRYREYRWGIETSLGGMGNRFLDGGIERAAFPLQISGMLYLIPSGMLNLYLLGGAQVVFSMVKWQLPNLQTDQMFTQLGLQGGVGAELNLSRYFALTADIRAFGLVRTDGGDGAFYSRVDERAVVPDKSAGMQFNAGVSFRF